MTTSDICNDEADEVLVRNADDMKSSLYIVDDSGQTYQQGSENLVGLDRSPQSEIGRSTAEMHHAAERQQNDIENTKEEKIHNQTKNKKSDPLLWMKNKQK